MNFPHVQEHTHTHTHGVETEVQKALPPRMGDEKLLSRERDLTFANDPIYKPNYRLITTLQELTSNPMHDFQQPTLPFFAKLCLELFHHANEEQKTFAYQATCNILRQNFQFLSAKQAVP